MFVIAGVTGRVGSATAERLLAVDARIRVLVRSEADAQAWKSRGAEARVVGLEDRVALTDALHGCEGFFVLLPFDLTVDDLDDHANRLIASIAGAVADERVPHVVMLSSGGADLAEGTGPITGLFRLERALRSTGTTLTALRAAHFQEKLGDVLDVVRDDGVYPVFASSAEIPMPMVATADLGSVAAEALLSPPDASEAVDVVGPSYSESQVAAALGVALEREVQVAIVPDDGWSSTLVETGFARHIAESLAELYCADQNGLLAPRGDREVHVRTPLEATISQVLAVR